MFLIIIIILYSFHIPSETGSDLSTRTKHSWHRQLAYPIRFELATVGYSQATASSFELVVAGLQEAGEEVACYSDPGFVT